MKYREFVNVLKEDSKCNFIALAVTLLHANSIDATIKYLESEGVEVNGYILIAPHHVTGKILSENSFLCKDNKRIKIIDFSLNSAINTGIYKRCTQKLAAFKNSYISYGDEERIFVAGSEFNTFWFDELASIFPQKNITYVLIDDGGGSYVDRISDLRNEILYKCKNKVSVSDRLRIIYHQVMWFFDKKIMNNLERKERLHKCTIFCLDTDNREIKVNSKMSRHYRNVFRDIGSEIPEKYIEEFSRSALINTQCLEENKIIENHLDIEIYQKCIEILKRGGLKPVIKTHPRELNLEKYKNFGCYICTGAFYSQESILAKLETQPKCIISIFSSTLLNANGIFDIPAISLAKIVKKENINETLKRQLDEFIEVYENVYYIPENWDEFERIVETL